MARSVRSLVSSVVLAAIPTVGFGQQLLAPMAQPAHIAGTVTDTNGDLIPGATVHVNAASQNSRSAVANDSAFFQIDNLTPGTKYQVTVSAEGFADWKSSEVLLQPGQFDVLNDIQLKMVGEGASVVVSASQEDIAVAQVKMEEHQRVLDS